MVIPDSFEKNTIPFLRIVLAQILVRRNNDIMHLHVNLSFACIHKCAGLLAILCMYTQLLSKLDWAKPLANLATSKSI